MRKIYSRELKNEIIQWEEHCWKLFQKRMKPFCQKYIGNCETCLQN